jgi:polyphosphate glucokinase
MELSHLPFTKRGLIQDYVGSDALRRLGRKRWSANANTIIKHLRSILDVHDIIIGGGNAWRIKPLPRRIRLGDNQLAFAGGFRAWRRGARTAP